MFKIGQKVRFTGEGANDAISSELTGGLGNLPKGAIGTIQPPHPLVAAIRYTVIFDGHSGRHPDGLWQCALNQLAPIEDEVGFKRFLDRVLTPIPGLTETA